MLQDIEVQKEGQEKVLAKEFHEIRDPIHVFVRLDSAERQVLDSLPLQRLRYIHQLALTHFVYPSATHKRFEHSLGVMELAGRVFDTITNSENVTDQIRNHLTPLRNPDQLKYWRRVLRMAADLVFAERSIYDEVVGWIVANRVDILKHK